jgi:hypothetical protein
MASTLSFFMTPEDEEAFLRSIEGRHFVFYPEVFPNDFEPMAATAENASKLTDEAYYLVLPGVDEMVVHTLRRGPHAGMNELDEVASPAIHYERSLEIEGELRSGRLWAELETVGDPTRRMRKGFALKGAFEEMRNYFKKRYVRSEPTGFFVGPLAARRAKEGLKLREAGRKGGLVRPFR